MKFVDYRKHSENEIKSESEISRDKEALQKMIMTRTTQIKLEVVDRLYQIVDIGAIDMEDNLASIVKEAEWLYAYGFNLGCISVVGLVAEEFSKILSKKNEISKSRTSNQQVRIEQLESKGVIDKKTSEKLDYIRLIRNKCMHYKSDFENLENSVVQSYALNCLNNFKQIIAEYYNQVDYFEHGVLSATNRDEMEMIIRNATARNEGIDLSISDQKYLLNKRVYQILEIDIEGDFKEMTLLDLEVSIPVIVDLTYSQADYISNIKLKENQFIIASCISIISTFGLSAEWQLLNIDEILF